MYIECEYCGRNIRLRERNITTEETEIECDKCLRKNIIKMNIERISKIKPQERYVLSLLLDEPLNDFNIDYLFMDINLKTKNITIRDRIGTKLNNIKIKRLESISEIQLDGLHLYFIKNTYQEDVYKKRVKSSDYGKDVDKVIELNEFNCDYHNDDFDQRIGVKIIYKDTSELLSMYVDKNLDKIYLVFDNVKV